MSNLLKFPANFLWGVSTSAYQTEGGNINDWSEWEKTRLRQGFGGQARGVVGNSEDYICGKACDSYNRYEEDFELAKNLNCGAFRLGLEWSRIEPKPGEFDFKEILHYREVLRAVKARNLKVVLTLWHYTLPLWLAREGGWSNKKVTEYFARYVELVAKELGEYVDYWVTLNEPFVHLGYGYITGKFPPNKKFAFFKVFKAMRNFFASHERAYDIIHDRLPEAQVSLTYLTAYVEPANRWNPLEWILVKAIDYFRNDYYFKSKKSKFDFVGVNYYHHNRVVSHPPFIKNENKILSDFGWEIYPKGIYHVLMDFKSCGKPILILENGLADAKDKLRAKFIVDHLRYVYEAIKDGADVRGYFYWSLLDNFEWADGWPMKFGLYAVDRKTFKRTARASAEVYAEICKNNAVRIN